MFPDYSDDFFITLTDFSGVQSISIDCSWFEQLGQPAEGVGVQPAGEGRVQERGLEPPPPGAAAAQYPYTRNAKWSQFEGVWVGFSLWLASQPAPSKRIKPPGYTKNLCFFCFFSLASRGLAKPKKTKKTKKPKIFGISRGLGSFARGWLVSQP